MGSGSSADKQAAAECNNDINTAALRGSVAAVRHLLRQSPERLNEADSGRWRPLHYAARHDHSALLALLLDKRAELEVKDLLGRTPLHWAAHSGHLSVVERLIAAGAAVEAKDTDGKMPYDIARAEGREKVMAYLQEEAEKAPKETSAEPSAQDCQAEAKNTDAPEDAEADKEAAAQCNDDIHLAARQGSVPAVRHLLRQRPEDIEKKSFFGSQPLHDAASGGSVALVQLLLDKRAELEAKDNLGQTPLVNAANRGQLSVVEQLIAARAVVDVADNKGETPMHFAAMKGHLQVVERLIAAGAAVDAADKDGDTPYHVAKRWDRKETMALLDTVFVVSVVLLSGRECSCKLSENKSIADLKETAERELEIKIQGLVNSEGEALNESDSLRKANVRAGDTLTAMS